MSVSPSPPISEALVRLHGRWAELAAVREALSRSDVRIVVARGAGGAGKTALMRAVVDDARAAGGLTGCGKYAQGQASRDLEPLINAIEEALAAGLDQLFDPAAGLRDLKRALGDNAPILAGVGSGVLRALAGTRDAGPVTAERADERLAQAVLQVLRWMEGFGAPVLLLIDDWGRAGAQVRRLFSRLAAEPSLSLVRLLATERDEERFEDAPAGTVVVPVGPLAADAQLDLAAEILGPKSGAAAEVVAFLGAAAETPFDLIESVRILDRAALSRSGGRWRLDPRRAVSALAGAAARSVVRRVADLDAGALTLARMLAVYGDDAELADLASAGRHDAAAARAAAEVLVAAGLVRLAGAKIRYAHDRLRAEVLLDIPPRVRAGMSAALAEALREAGAQPGEGERGMAMLWRRLEGGLDGGDPAWWRDAFAAGAFAARQVGDRAAAETFVRAGLELCGRSGGFTYGLLCEAASAAISRGDHAEACRLADAMGGHATTPGERAAADEMRVFARRVSGDLDAALDVAREVVARMKVRLPRRVTAANLAQAVAWVFSLDPRRADQPISPEELAVEAPMMRAINGIGSLLFERNPLLVVVLVTRTLSTRVVYGTAAGAATLSLLCCSFGAYRRAAAWAEAADRLQGPEQPLRAIARQYASSFGHVFARPRPVTRSRGEEMEALAYAGGDLAVAVYGNRDRVLDALFSDDHLTGTARLADEAIRVAERLSDPPTIPHCRALRQFIAQLQTGGEDGWRLDGVHLDLDASYAALQSEAMANTGRAVAALEAMLGVVYGRYAKVAAMTQRPWPKFAPAPFQAQSQIWAFATGLALYRTGRRPTAMQLWNLRRLARLNPNDFAHRARLLDAEGLRVRGRRARALGAYGQAVAAAKASRCLLECGLVAAAAAEGAESLGDTEAADAWRETAIDAWRALGADGLLAARFGLAADAEAAEALSALMADLQVQHAEREQELNSAREAAERASRAKSRLLATVGHELRTPLQGALGLIELADAPGAPLDAENLRRALLNLAGVVGDLTDLGALEGGLLPVGRERYDAEAAAASVAALHLPAARTLGREIVFEGLGAPLWIWGDEGRLRQVLGNLVANALRHGQGEVRLTLDTAPGERLICAVSDEGPPLSDAALLRIFEPFDRAGREADDSGLGVGLFLGRNLARAMGGDLVVQARPDGGKAFVLEIAAPVAEAGERDPRSSGLAGLKVLLAEDTELSRAVLAALLRREGCEVVEVEDGATALARLDEGGFDLALLDQRMPRLLGLQVAERLPRTDGRPMCVLMTAGADAGLERTARAAGVDLVLQKPVTLAQLRALAPARARPAISRAAELRVQLGEGAADLFAELRPSVEREVAELAAALASNDTPRFDAQRHRLRGLADHFGLQTIVEAVDETGPPAFMIERLGAAVQRTDWSAYEAG